MDIKVNIDRLNKDIEDLANIGSDPKGGITRPSFSQADLEAREWLKDKIQSAGLELQQDGAGNIFGRIGSKEKTIMTGSHIDTVIHGGMFDGALGVLSSLECLRRIKEEKIELSKSLEMVSFTDEEGNLTGDFLGSRAFVGLLERELLEKSITQFGKPLTEILRNTEFTIDSILDAKTQRTDIEAFLEIHIEQGPVLETENKSIGIVDCIAGKYYRLCSFSGKASHAGTTPFELRQDAFLGLSDFALKATHHVATNHYGSMETIGKIAISPGAFNIIPKQADFTLDFRSTSNQALLDIDKKLMSLGNDIGSTRGLKFNSVIVDKTDPVLLSENLTKIMKEVCEQLDYPYIILSSGAGHDAQILSQLTQTGMIFIPCIDGISHSPQEMIKWEDAEKGANVLLHSLLKMAT
ncbi:MAG: Zn-dependent hydrolase [Candidatus Aminicenantaceae bacterium]